MQLAICWFYVGNDYFLRTPRYNIAIRVKKPHILQFKPTSIYTGISFASICVAGFKYSLFVLLITLHFKYLYIKQKAPP